MADASRYPKPMPIAPQFLSLLLCLLPQGATTPQGDAEKPEVISKQQLVDLVDAAHRSGKNKDLQPQAFSSRFKFIIQSREEGSISTTLESKFSSQLSYEYRGKGVKDMIYYKLLEGGQSIERGMDKRGPWQRFQGKKTQSLNGKEFQQDREKVQGELRLCNQLLRFLDPAKVLRQLRAIKPVASEEIRIKRGTSVACHFLEGVLDTFPIYQSQAAGPVQLQIWIRKDNSRLLRVRVFPLDDSNTPSPQGEQILMVEHRLISDALLLPKKLIIARVDRDKGDGDKVENTAELGFERSDLNPELSAKDFDRP